MKLVASKTSPYARKIRVLLAESRYMRRVWLEFRWSLLFTLTVWGAAVVILHEWYPVVAGEEPMEWDRAAYYVLVMTAFEAMREGRSRSIRDLPCRCKSGAVIYVDVTASPLSYRGRKVIDTPVVEFAEE